jgi:hypothetical protein
LILCQAAEIQRKQEQGLLTPLLLTPEALMERNETADRIPETGRQHSAKSN